jgi:copper chaperone
MTLTLTVPTIVCDRCVQAVTQAIQGVDVQAQVTVDLNTKVVTVETTADRAVLATAIDAAGHDVM